MNIKRDVVSWMRSWYGKRTLGKNYGNLKKAWTLVNNNVSLILANALYECRMLIIGETMCGVHGNSSIFFVNLNQF